MDGQRGSVLTRKSIVLMRCQLLFSLPFLVVVINAAIDGIIVIVVGDKRCFVAICKAVVVAGRVGSADVKSGVVALLVCVVFVSVGVTIMTLTVLVDVALV